MSEITWQQALDAAVRSCDQMTLDYTCLLIGLTTDVPTTEIEAELTAILNRVDVVTQAFWSAPCECGEAHRIALLN